MGLTENKGMNGFDVASSEAAEVGSTPTISTWDDVARCLGEAIDNELIYEDWDWGEDGDEYPIIHIDWEIVDELYPGLFPNQHFAVDALADVGHFDKEESIKLYIEEAKEMGIYEYAPGFVDTPE